MSDHPPNELAERRLLEVSDAFTEALGRFLPVAQTFVELTQAGRAGGAEVQAARIRVHLAAEAFAHEAMRILAGLAGDAAISVVIESDGQEC